MKLNKILALSAVLVSGLSLASCNNEEEPANETVTVGLGYTYSYEFHAAVADNPETEKDETATAYGQLDLTTAFVAFDAEGAIVDARIDVVQIKAEEAAEGGLQIKAGTKLDDAGSIKSKLELGKDYNMVNYGNAIAEVDAQIEAFADWSVGQTVEGLKANVAEEHGYGTAPHADLNSSVTIVCHDFVAAIESAWANKTTETYDKAGAAGIAMVSGLGLSYGTWEMTVDVAGVMADNGTVVASQIDALVLQLNHDTETGAITVKEGQKYINEDNAMVSKKSLGAKYAMAESNGGQAGCTKEWDEQAEIIELAANGKTATQIAELAANEGDLAGATIYLNNYLTALSKATEYAGKEHVGPQAE